MTIPYFICVCVIGILGMLLHCYLKRGIEKTVNFFLFSFMLTFSRGGVHVFNFANFSDTTQMIILKTACSTVIWIFMFYLSFSLAERIGDRIYIFNNKLFPVLFFAGVTIAAFSYSVEYTASVMGWWNGAVVGANKILLIPLTLITKWYFFYVYFLAAYLLITSTKFKNSNVKAVFFILPFIHAWIPRFFDASIIKPIEEIVVFTFILACSFISTLKLESDNEMHARESFKKSVHLLIENIPVAMSIIVFVVLIIMSIAHKASIVPYLPLLFVIVLSVQQISFASIIVLAIIVSFTFGAGAIPALIILSVIILFKIAGILLKKRNVL